MPMIDFPRWSYATKDGSSRLT